MLISVEGVYRNGRIELIKQPPNITEGAQVIVTFVQSNAIDLATQGIDTAQAEVLRAQLATFAEDWNSPEMDIYNNYDAAKANDSTQ